MWLEKNYESETIKEGLSYMVLLAGYKCYINTNQNKEITLTIVSYVDSLL